MVATVGWPFDDLVFILSVICLPILLFKHIIAQVETILKHLIVAER